jgi:hypothetical protein
VINKLFRRVGIIVLVLIACATTCVAQENNLENQDPYSIQLVSRFLQMPPGLAMGVSFTEKQIARLGDRLSIALLKIYSEKELKDPQNIKLYLPMIKGAFLGSTMIQISEDRKPRVTLFLLKYLRNEIKDKELIKEVSETIQTLEEKEDHK